MEWTINLGVVIWWICLLWFINVLMQILHGPYIIIKETLIYLKKGLVMLFRLLYIFISFPRYAIKYTQTTHNR